MKRITYLIIGLSMVHQLYAQGAEPDHRPSPADLLIVDTALTRDEIIDAVYQTKEEKLLSAIGRASTAEEQIPFPLVWSDQIRLHNKNYTICVFDSPFHVMPGSNPRVLILIDCEKRIMTWNQFTCEPPFRFGSIIQKPSDNTASLITINPASRFGGELWFERYKIETSKITKISEGYNPREMNPAQQDETRNPH